MEVETPTKFTLFTYQKQDLIKSILQLLKLHLSIENEEELIQRYLDGEFNHKIPDEFWNATIQQLQLKNNGSNEKSIIKNTKKWFKDGIDQLCNQDQLSKEDRKNHLTRFKQLFQEQYKDEDIRIQLIKQIFNEFSLQKRSSYNQRLVNAYLTNQYKTLTKQNQINLTHLKGTCQQQMDLNIFDYQYEFEEVGGQTGEIGVFRGTFTVEAQMKQYAKRYSDQLDLLLLLTYDDE